MEFNLIKDYLKIIDTLKKDNKLITFGIIFDRLVKKLHSTRKKSALGK